MIARLLLAACVAALAATAQAGWVLDGEQSDLSFVSVKAANVGEVHRFHKMSGGVDETGKTTITIDLASVDTLIPVRDDRLREVLFEVANFPTAQISAQVPLDEVNALAVGAVKPMALEGTLKLKEAELALTMQVVVARLAESRVMVTSAQPVVVNAAGVGLVAGVEKLREIAGLPSISNAVPVSFVLVFHIPASLEVSNARMREPLPGQDKTVGYFEAKNVGATPIVLKGASSDAARAIELHESIKDGDMMRMRRLQEVEIGSGETVSFEPGGKHLMVFGVTELAESVTVRLTLADGAGVEVPFQRFGFTKN